MERQIREQLERLEAVHDIRILFACESGSRAWGFASPDSDYDVRFVYVHRRDWYLGIERGADCIDGPQDAVLDIRGVELRRFLQLFRASNATVYEWLQSTAWYQKEASFVASLRSLVGSFFSPRAGMHHYLGLTRNTMEHYLQGEEVSLKKYFYALRPVLAAAWIEEHGSCPPMEFSRLRPLIRDRTVGDKVDALLARKSGVAESFRVAPDAVVHQFIEASLQRCILYAKTLEMKNADAAPLNELFRNIINQPWTYKACATED